MSTMATAIATTSIPRSRPRSSLRLLNESLQALVVMPADELYAPLAVIRARVLASVIATVLLALLAAFFLSGRFVGDIERIRNAVAAFAQGDWRRLETSSRDELGGALVDSINDMTLKVAERMRRDEAESWRRLVRVVSHEINNTLAPIKSVAASLRTGLPRRLRDDDAAADVDMALKLIVERVDSLSSFIDGYAEVAKLPPPNRQLTDVDRLIAGATALFAEQAAAREVAIDVREAAGGAAELDAQQLERVLVNVIKNAIEASPAKAPSWSAARASPVRSRSASPTMDPASATRRGATCSCPTSAPSPAAAASAWRSPGKSWSRTAAR